MMPPLLELLDQEYDVFFRPEQYGIDEPIDPYTWTIERIKHSNRDMFIIVDDEGCPISRYIESVETLIEVVNKAKELHILML